MARGPPAIPTTMISNPYPKPKEHIPRLTYCELCDRTLPTKDWQAHKNSKKHREAEAKERGELDAIKNSTDSGGDSTRFGNDIAFGIAAALGDGEWGAGEGFTSTTKPTSYKDRGGGGGDQRACFGCGETGHQKRDCPKGSGGQACHNCGETGHRKADCPEPPKPRGGGGGGGSDRLCFNCNQLGHNKSDCPEPRTGGGGGGGGGRACHNCGEEGHMSRECDKPRVMKCRNCDEEGHAARECTKPRDWTRVQCRNCNNYGHGEKRCPEPIAKTTGGDWGNDAVDAASSGGTGEWANALTTTATTGSWADDTTAAAENNDWGNTTASTMW